MAERKKKFPAPFQAKVVDEICQRLSAGEPLRRICLDDHMPRWQMVYEWMSADPEIAGRIAHAREVGYDAIAEEAMQIADTPVEGTETEESEQGIKIKRGDMLGHRKLQVETRLKLLAKWSPKKYGDSTRLEHSGRLGLEGLVASDDE